MNVARENPGAPVDLVDLVTLQTHSTAELAQLAAHEGLTLPPGFDHGQLMFALLEHRLGANGLGWIEGTFDLHPDGFGFLRSAARSFAPQPWDVHVNTSQVRKLNLKAGHRIAGPVRGPRGGERFFALQHVERVNDCEPDRLDRRVPFAARTPILPHTRLRLGHAQAAPDLRAIDLLAPWGKGQRVLLTSPPEHQRAQLLVELACALRKNHYDLLVITCLLDQRPEDSAAAQRLGGEHGVEVVASTFDEPPARHVALADLTLARTQHEVEAGRDVVLLFDSLSALARACNVDQPPSGHLACVGLDAFATARGKKLFSAARACEEGGSLSIVAAAVDGDNRVDQAILEDFRHRGNSEVVFTSEPQPDARGALLDVLRTTTRTEDLLLEGPAITALRQLRNDLSNVPPAQRLAALRARC